MADFVKVRSEYPPTVPVSVLALDYPAPVEGWHVFLAAKGIRIVSDHVGRDAIDCRDASRLFAEKRERELRIAALQKVAEAEAIAADEAFRASLPRGKSWLDMPLGESPASVMLEEAKAEQPRRRPTDAEWMFARPGEITRGTFNGEDWQ